MSASSTRLRIVGARVLYGTAFADAQLCVESGVLTDGSLPAVDLSGYLVLPGIVDLHGDAFERHMAPRPTAPFPMRTGLIATDRDAAANGVTTAWMAQSWSWEGGLRGPDYAEDFLQAHASYSSEMATDLRVQLRCETHTMDTQERLIETVQRHRVSYVVFNDHLSEAVDLSIKDPDSLRLWANKAGRSPQEHMDLVQSCKAREKEVPRYLCNLATAFDRMGVRYGSHDDPDGATRERFSMIGAKICEFPTSMGAAVVARTWEDPILMGAPNVVRGASQSGNVSAEILIEHRACDALVSDYYYPALSQAAFALSDRGIMPLADAWMMISANPARIMGMNDRGVIEQGRRADLTIVNEATRAIEGTMSGGRWTHLCGELAARVSQIGHAVQVAAE